MNRNTELERRISEVVAAWEINGRRWTALEWAHVLRTNFHLRLKKKKETKPGAKKP